MAIANDHHYDARRSTGPGFPLHRAALPVGSRIAVETVSCGQYPALCVVAWTMLGTPGASDTAGRPPPHSHDTTALRGGVIAGAGAGYGDGYRVPLCKAWRRAETGRGGACNGWVVCVVCVG